MQIGKASEQQQGLNRIIAIGTAVAVLFTSLFLPFHSGTTSYDRNLGYAFLLNPPIRGSVDFGRLCIEYVAIFAVGTIAWLVLTPIGAAEKSLIVLFKRTPPQAIRVFRFVYLAAALVTFVVCLAASALVGLFALGIYGMAVVIYFVGKYVAPAAKRDLLIVTAIMGAQACWGLLAGINALMNSWTKIVELSDQQTHNAMIGLVLEFLYIAAIIWFLKKTTLRATATLFIYTCFLLCTYLANIQFDLLALAAKNAAGFQISIFVLALLLLPASYYEYFDAARK